MFKWNNPTVQMLGRWQPWHEGHNELFKKALTKTGQVVIMIRDVEGVDAGMGNTDNPFNSYEVKVNIISALSQAGYQHHVDLLFQHFLLEIKILNHFCLIVLLH